MIGPSPRHVASDFQVMRPTCKRGHIAPLEVVLHKRIRAPSGLISLDPQHRDSGYLRMVHLCFSEWPGGGKAELIDEVSGSVHPTGREVHAIGGFDSVKCRVNKRRSEQHLMQSRPVEGAENAVLVVVHRVVNTHRILKSVAREASREAAHASNRQVAWNTPNLSRNRI